ncbi:hypothetical protein KDX27_41865 [Burkholderia cenocepacia]|uniref:hypothetical protein n=1 Tax=Burkholderia cenocepacia TaxID=95486 RepID=UPI001B92024A|nr:hypothetical protein [Burkholderia cenocepacia]MBR8174216.1 hypothetical protein [Burkholderia cenocepacia]
MTASMYQSGRVVNHSNSNVASIDVHGIRFAKTASGCRIFIIASRRLREKSGVLIGISHSQKIGQFHIETGSCATLYLQLFARDAWLRAILQNRLRTHRARLPPGVSLPVWR